MTDAAPDPSPRAEAPSPNGPDETGREEKGSRETRAGTDSGPDSERKSEP